MYPPPTGPDGMEYPFQSDPTRYLEGRQLPPHYEDMLTAARQSLADTQSQLTDALLADVNAAQSALQSSAIETQTAIATQIGQADSALRSLTGPMLTAIDKQTDSGLTALVDANIALENAGIPMPRTRLDAQADLLDESGMRTMARLTGVNPDGISEPVTASAAQTTEPIAVAGGCPASHPYTAYMPALGAMCSTLPPNPDGSPAPGADLIPLSSGIPSPPNIPPYVPPPAPFPYPPAPVPVPPVPPPEPPTCECPEPSPAPSPKECNVCPAPIVNLYCPSGKSGDEPVLPHPPTPTPDSLPVSPTPSPPPPPPPASEPSPERLTSGSPWDEVYTKGVCPWLAAQKASWLTEKHIQDTGAVPGISQTLADDLYRTGIAAAATLGDIISSGFDAKNAPTVMTSTYQATGGIISDIAFARTAFGSIPDSLVGNAQERQLAWVLGFTIGQSSKAEGQTGIPLTTITLPLRYLYQSQYPYEIPQPADIDRLRRVGLIGEPDWHCLINMHGIDAQYRNDVFKANEPTLTPDEIERARMRRILPESFVKRYYALNGITSPDTQAVYRGLAEYVPGPADEVRFMVRDVFDPEVVRTQQLDKDFDKKFQGRIIEWAEAQGMDRDTFLYYWMAHWQYPSNTALYEMLHRLRPDRPAIQEWLKAQAAFMAGDQSGDPPAKPLVVTVDDVKRAIEINDMSPQWVDALVAISYHPVNQTTIKQAYQAQVIDGDALYHGFRDNGYNETDARLMVTIEQTLRARRQSTLSGVWTIRRILKEYMDGTINGVQADLLLRPLIPDNIMRAQALSGADEMVATGLNRERIKRIRRGFFVGEVDANQTALALGGTGMAQGRIRQVIDMWTEQVRGRYREPTAKLIVQWMQIGVIEIVDARNRLIRLGYSFTDADRITAQGLVARADRLEAKADKAQAKIEKAIKNQKQASREAIQDLKDRQAELEKQKKAIDAEAKRIQDEIDKRTQSVVVKPIDKNMPNGVRADTGA